MNNENLVLNKIFDFQKWQRLQDSIAIVTKVAMITVDYKGNPISKHSNCSNFCKAVRSDKNLVKYCQKCDSRGGLEAVRLNEPYIYLCHYKVIDIAIPIIVDEKYIGAIMAGQVRILDENGDLEQIVTTKNKNIEDDDLRGYYNELPVMTYNEVKNIASMLNLLCTYLIDEALDKNLILDMYNEFNKSDNKELLKGYSVKNMEKAKKQLSNAIISAHVEDNHYHKDSNVNFSSTLKPAIDYIYNNKSENISVDRLASICHISPSYFSRLFTKEAGEKFSVYLSKLKIQWAKDLLEKTEMNINEVSEELGFGECGYFIKVFKKYEGVTPFIYRKYCKK